MEHSFYCKDMDDSATVVDVYDSAALIGKDFEYLIEQYGVEAVTDLMPKVIRVLEQLEYLASKNERENETLLQMESTIARLNIEKEERIKERHLYEQELEQIEESYRKETKDLYQMVANLQQQNKKLQTRLSDKASGQDAVVEKSEEDLNLMQSLKETVAKQRGKIKGLQTEVKQKEFDLEMMRKRVDRLTHENTSLHLASNLSHNQSTRLKAEHDSLQNTIREKDQQILDIRNRISQEHLAAKPSPMQSQVTQMSGTLRDNKMVTHIKTMQAKHLINEKSELQTQLQDRDQRLRVMSVEKSQTEESGSNLIGQMVGNLKENDNPRFTLNELKDVLTERNTLKSKLIEIEEELAYYKTKNEPEASFEANWESEEKCSTLPSSLEASFVGEVQGPINREPWEKLQGKPESGIRKFFERFPVELPDTIRVNLVPGELAGIAQAKASSFWDLRMGRSGGTVNPEPQERPKSFVLDSNSKP